MAKKKIKKDSKPYVSPLREVYLAQSVTPSAYESAGDSWINYGNTPPFKNLYPQFLIDMYNNSATHRAIVDAASSYIAGKGILIDDKGDIEQTSKLNLLLKNINSKETIEGLLNKIGKDLYLQGGFAINIIYTKDKLGIASITHIPTEKLRIGVPNANGIVDTYWISADWANYRKKEHTPQPVAAFNPNDRTETNQILYVSDYTPGLDLYGAPSYTASTNWILTDSLISEYQYNNVNNGFSPTTWINFNDGQPTEEEQQVIERAITKKMTGVGGKKMVLTFTDEGTNTPDIQNLALSDAHNMYQTLNELVIQNLMIGHRVVSPSLMGVKTEGQLGGKNELLEAYELYSRSVIQPYQDIIVKALSKVFSVAGIYVDFTIKDVAPFSNKFGVDVLKEVLTKDELRAELGLEPLEAAEEVISEEAKLSKELAEDEIEAMLEGLGELEADLLNDYEILSVEDTNDEEEDTDLEAQLNEKLELSVVKPGKANPNMKSKQDGTSKQTTEVGNTFRVRYKYVGNAAPERAFCKIMMRKAASGILYRKEDILKMSTMSVNPGWGKGGKNTYSIWKFKGGGACKHAFKRVIMVQKGKRAKKSDEVITTSASKSRGFKPPVNKGGEWRTKPTDMPNKGFINK